METELINLHELKSLYGDDSAKELLEMSLSEGRGLIANLKKSVPARDASSVGADAHQLKGMSATMTMTKVADLSYKLEQCAKLDTWDGSEDLLSNIENCFSDIENYLKTALP